MVIGDIDGDSGVMVIWMLMVVVDIDGDEGGVFNK